MRRNDSQSVFSTLFYWSFRRIWSGRFIQALEIFMWCVLAIGLAFMWSEYRFRMVALPIPAFVFLLIPILSIAVAVIAMYNTSFISGPSDVALSTIPVSGLTVISSQLFAMFLTWARLAIPLVILSMSMDIPLFYREGSLQYAWLGRPHPAPGFDWLTEALSIRDLGILIGRKLALDFGHVEESVASYILYLGACALPWTLSLWWSAKLKSGRGPAIFFFFVSLVSYGGLILALYQAVLFFSKIFAPQTRSTRDDENFLAVLASWLRTVQRDDFDGWYLRIIFIGIISLVVGAFAFFNAARLWRRGR